VIELFGADSGFLAANAALATGHADLVMIPEVFMELSALSCGQLLDLYAEHMKDVVINNDPKRPHGMVILAEGVGRILREKGAILGKRSVGEHFAEDLKEYFSDCLDGTRARPIEVFTSQPKHLIRAGKANAHDQIYCERLGALAVDNALAGYTDFLVSQWLTEFVLVPLDLVAGKRKSIPPHGMFWKQVCKMTGQPSLPTAAFGSSAPSSNAAGPDCSTVHVRDDVS
jgi:6-phosphofructokinase 1